ncbi:dihydropteroate synthase [Reinekea sp. MED297]|uniref:dihydropteroate synthase n=2 Tax=Reinekea TaxID=230494 RepID=A4BAL9_9GAMM|nr:dihydropteroate synthase [Reinekea sp. MED297] [Reinekea blandensis MED297]
MGVLNVTPDSFSDGGRYRHLDDALRQAQQMVADGAALLDIGGESTRPGAASVSVAEELDRVIPVVERLASELDVVLSVDTSTPDVIREAARVGAHLINDVRALRREGALAAAVDVNLPVCLMHMQGKPATMQERPEYTDVLVDVKTFLEARMEACLNAGIDRDKILLDPGFGFGKTVDHNLRLANHLQDVAIGGRPLLVGMSRKSTIGTVLNRPVDARLSGTLAFTAAATWQNAFIVRVHDVAENVDVVRMIEAIRMERYESKDEHRSQQ